jgi:hypothetical protein
MIYTYCKQLQHFNITDMEEIIKMSYKILDNYIMVHNINRLVMKNAKCHKCYSIKIKIVIDFTLNAHLILHVNYFRIKYLIILQQ